MEYKIYKNRYRVYENGDVHGVHGKKLSLRINQFGYSKFVIYSENKKTNEFAHRIVAKCFIPNPENKPQVNHKDGNKLNNCASNL